MVEVLEFIFRSFWTFVGVCVLLYIAGFPLLGIAAVIGSAISALRGGK